MSAAGRPLVLVGASGLAREVVAVARQRGALEVAGVVDDDPERAGEDLDGVPVLGAPDVLARRTDVDVLVCVGHGSARAALVGRLAALGVGADRYATVVHPSAEVPRGCTVGAGSVLLAGVVLTAGVRVGAHVVLMPHVTLTHGDRVQDFATLAAGVSLGGGVVVGERAYLGMNAAVRERVRVGAGATLGMGAALLTDLPDGETWAGVPARPVRGASAGDGAAGRRTGSLGERPVAV
ncbi:NeuD/PglB/VioB family sugar acetyltransferase [Cellulomonas hominis]|uniref:NeuD/PglB/VioB family sugar acetyltransferase n=1 Tax=Cellulomonas hominis TaxID=156981 RepID=UPI001B922AD5|nr:NeuD/PglB/VioB family sugar acetyltransferase [Cellulomonas hominis]VTR76318.1 Putative acetyltransferase EpsM [Cellulomonas hominis]